VQKHQVKTHTLQKCTRWP